MYARKSQSEQGQILVIFSIAVIAFIAILALVLDGGLAYASRRAAQNAADAGALAGARVYCVTDDITQATYTAREYAITRNEAADADVTFDTVNKITTVTATVPLATSFASLWGFGTVDASAVAEAGCVSPGVGESVLPIAFSCRDVLVPGLTDSEDCQMEFINYDELQEYIENPYPTSGPYPIYPELYIIMENDKDQDDHCAPPWGNGTIDCDLDNDGDPDITVDGGRSWLDLDGSGGGASDLSLWIQNGYPFDLDIHTWVSEQSGVANSIFQTAEDYKLSCRYGYPCPSSADNQIHIVALPIIDDLCEGDPQTICPSLWHSGQDTTTVGTGASLTYYHLAGFGAFYISCVKAPGASLPTWVIGGDCPGHNYAVELGAIDNNTKSIEGYFIEGFLPGLGGGGSGSGVDTGAYVLLLTK